MDVYTQGEKGYVAAMALVASGRAHLAGERYDGYGRHVAAIGSYRANAPGVMRIGSDFFTLAIKDYRDWPLKWWREAVQNAIDAGAKKVRLSVTKRDDGNYQIECEDDGHGMSQETLIDKFLVLGGSGKPAGGGTVGGFGKAKELLILPWIAWRIESRDYVVEGNGASFDIKPSTPREGLLLQVVMPPDRHTDETKAEDFVRKCYLPGVTFLIGKDLKRVKADVAPGKLIRTLSAGEAGADVYYRKGESDEALVRVNGLLMFTKWITSEARGTVVIELLGRSTELLTANRDGFANWRFADAIDGLMSEISVDPRSALKGKTNVIKKRYVGRGLISTTMQKDSIEEIMGILLVNYEAGKPASPGLSEAVSERLPSERQYPTSDGYVSSPSSSEAAAAMLSGLVVEGTSHASSIAKALAWEPDFFIWNEDPSFHVSSKFEPENMGPPLVKLARLWAELCRFVVIQLGHFRPFGVGWVFSEDTAAAYYQHEDGSEWLLLNPFQDPKRRRSMMSASSQDHLPYLYASAIHEATHLVDGVSGHSEVFSTALTKNMAKCFGKERQIKAIRRAVTARGAGVGKQEFEA